MEYEKLVYTNERGEKLEFSISSSYYVNVSKDVKGMSDIDNTIYTSSSVGQNGSTYIGQKLEPRKITITGYLNTKDKIQAINLRRRALKVLNPALKGKLTYSYAGYSKTIDCVVSDSPAFYKKTVLMQFDVDLTCPNPYWKNAQENKEDIAKWVETLEFPVIMEQNSGGVIFGYRIENVIKSLYNEGDVSTAMRIRIAAVAKVVNPEIRNMDTGEYVKLNMTMQAGDVVEITTEYGNKNVTLTRNGEQIDYFRALDVDSTFIQMEIGDNTYRYNADEGTSNMEVTIYYSPQYLGV